jgi:two-component system NarL family sensor kinase
MNKKIPTSKEFCRVSIRVKRATSRSRERTVQNSLSPNTALGLSSLREDIQQRIASDLHDSTCQHLIAATLSLLRLKRSANDTGIADKICDEIDVSINLALREIRSYSYLLYPQEILKDGLKSTIEEYVSGFSSRTSLKCITRITPEVRELACETQCSLLRFVQEALTNVFRHANATRVEVAIETRGNSLRLRVIDDGCGLPAGQKSGPRATSLGVGIQGMRSRARELGGTFQIHSSTGRRRGTTVCALLPYRRSREVPLLHHPGEESRLPLTQRQANKPGPFDIEKLDPRVDRRKLSARSSRDHETNSSSRRS